jgi:signal transduction histidine kinase
MDALVKRIGSSCRVLFRKGIHGFYANFIAPKSTDEDDRRREYILNVILIGSIAMLAFFDALVLYYSVRAGAAYHEVPFPLFSSILAFFVALFIFSRRGFPLLASYLLVGAYLLSDSYAAYQWGVDLHIVVLSYALIVLMASILVGTWFGFLTAGIIGVVIIPLRYMQLSGIILLQPRADDVMDAVTLVVVIFLILTLASLWNRELRKSLSRARQSESELKEERDLLEIKIEERTQALRQTQFEKVEQLYRFAEFGHLASGLFHDLLNLVNAASLADEIGQRQSHEEKLVGVKAKIPVSQASTISRRVESFMQAIRRQLDHRETCELFSLAEGVEYVMQLLSYKAMKENVRMVFSQKGDRTLLYFGDTFKFHQIVMNLVSNALDSYEGLAPDADVRERMVEISVRRKENGVEMKISDRGCGVSEGIRAKIFEPFFTTKGGDKGTGIGLATVRRFVEKDFHGTVLLESEEGRGSAFTVTFPIVEKR